MAYRDDCDVRLLMYRRANNPSTCSQAMDAFVWKEAFISARIERLATEAVWKRIMPWSARSESTSNHHSMWDGVAVKRRASLVRRPMPL